MSGVLGPKHPGVRLSYGTAGFRAKAELLDSTFFRMGALATLRSRARNGLAVGLMVTASHNPEPDNGIKLIDPDGGMLDMSWEAHASTLADAADGAFAEKLTDLATALGVSTESGACRVLVARDTRAHSERLAQLALSGVAQLGGASEECGVLTTPQLHHIVRHANGPAAAGPHVGPSTWASESGYYEMLSSAFTSLVPPSLASGRGVLWVDAACGVGSLALARLQESMGDALTLKIANQVGDGELNAGCGAEFVQKGRLPPRGQTSPIGHSPGSQGDSRACSLDGDADRIVYHYWRTQQSDEGAIRVGEKRSSSDAAGENQRSSEWRLLDGDKLAALFASFLTEEVAALGLSGTLSMAVVQTAYANGASGRYIRSLGVPLRLAKTGVKHVHHVAIE